MVHAVSSLRILLVYCQDWRSRTQQDKGADKGPSRSIDADSANGQVEKVRKKHNTNKLSSWTTETMRLITLVDV